MEPRITTNESKLNELSEKIIKQSNRKLFRQISAFILPKPCGFSTPRTRMPAGIRQGLRPLRTLVHVCQCAGIRVHAIDWRDSRRGHAGSESYASRLGTHVCPQAYVCAESRIRRVSAG